MRVRVAKPLFHRVADDSILNHPVNFGAGAVPCVVACGKVYVGDAASDCWDYIGVDFIVVRASAFWTAEFRVITNASPLCGGAAAPLICQT